MRDLGFILLNMAVLIFSNHNTLTTMLKTSYATQGKICSFVLYLFEKMFRKQFTIRLMKATKTAKKFPSTRLE